jgi:hypothetical protein
MSIFTSEKILLRILYEHTQGMKNKSESTSQTYYHCLNYLVIAKSAIIIKHRASPFHLNTLLGELG